MGCVQAELYTKSQGWLIVGLYVANAGLEDVTVPITLAPAVEALRTNCAQGCVLVVSNVSIVRVARGRADRSGSKFIQIDNHALGTDAPAVIVSCRPSRQPVPLRSPHN